MSKLEKAALCVWYLLLITWMIYMLALGCAATPSKGQEPMLPIERHHPFDDESVDAEVARWQMSPEFVFRQYEAACRYEAMADVIHMLNPLYPRQAIKEDAAYRHRVWSELDNIIRLRFSPSITNLREYLGDEAWHFRRMPAPTPWGYE
jgi:hypothetical protein